MHSYNVIVIMFLLPAFIPCFSDRNIDTNDVNKGVSQLVDATKILSLQDSTEFFKKAISVADSFVGVISKVNILVRIGLDIATFAGAIESDMAKLKKFVEEQFAIVNGKLDIIAEKIDEIHLVVQDELIKSKFNDYMQKSNNIKEVLDSFSKNPNNITTYLAKKGCESNSVREFMNFLKVEILEKEQGSLLEAIKRGNIHSVFYLWSRKIYAMFIEASVLYTQCFTISFANETTEEVFNMTLSNDSKKFQEMFLNITTKLDKENKEFFKPENYMTWARSDVTEMMKLHRDFKHQNFSDALVNKLSKKYEWKSWIVGSYDGDTSSYEEHSHDDNATNTIIIFRQENRCVFVVSLSKVQDEKQRNSYSTILQNAQNHVIRNGPHAMKSREKCLNIAEIIEDKYSNLQIDCVKSDKGIKVSNSPEAVLVTFEVTTYFFAKKTQTFPNRNECVDWVRENIEGHGVAPIFTPCESSTMTVTLSVIS